MFDLPRRGGVLPLVLLPLTLATHAARAMTGGGGNTATVLSIPTSDGRMVAAPRGSRVLTGRELLLALHNRIPAFSRQTKLACSACHYQFPQLTPFGRLFKLNGYTMTGLQTIEARTDSGSETLKLAPIPPASAMIVAGVTHTSVAIPGTQNDNAAFPQQFSLFLAGQITPNVGAFTQFTYDNAGGAFGVDNIDVRYASHHTVGGKDMLFGLTLHNNPTVQDVWNTVPAWSWPFMSSAVAPSPAAAPLIEGSLSQNVVGFGAYSLWNNLLYTELTAYRSSPQGSAQPLDSTATNTTHALAPYWRVALQHQGASTYAMLGTFGMVAELFPTGIDGATNRYADVGVDAQVEHRVGTGTAIARASYIDERQTLNGFLAEETPGAQFATNNLKSLHLNASYIPNLWLGLTLGYNQVLGGTDSVLYAPGGVNGSANGSPNSSNLMGEVAVNPWQNTRVGLQYVAYQKFNGASSNYSGIGRNASDNNAVYAYVWIAF